MGEKREQWDKDAYSLKEAKELWGNVAGTVDYMDLGIKAKKPDWSKVDALMRKSGKPAKYFMTLNGLVYTFEVHVASTKIVLNKLDIAKSGGPDQQRELLRRLSLRTKLVSKSDLTEFDKKNVDPKDQQEAVKLHARLDELKNEIDWQKQLAKAGNYRNKTVDVALFMNKEFTTWAKKKGYSGFTDFLMGVDDKRGWTSEMQTFVKSGKTGMSAKTLAPLLKALQDGTTPDFTQARKEVAHVLNSRMLPIYNKEGLRAIAEKIKALQGQVKEVERKLKSLKAA